MGNYTIFLMFENPRRGRQAKNCATNVPKILDLKTSSEQIFSKNCRWVPLVISESKQLRTYILLPEGENQWQSTGLLRYAKNHMI